MTWSTMQFMELALYFKVLVDRPMICKDEKQKDLLSLSLLREMICIVT